MAWIRIHTEQDGDLWSAYCDELGLASCGATEDKAIANLKHAVIAYCRVLDKRGILEETLKKKDVHFEPLPPHPHKVGQGKAGFGQLSPVLVA